MKKNLLTSFFISVLVPGLFSLNSENGMDYKSVEICRDSARHKTVLKLITNNVKTDSIIINNVDFSFDSFIKMNDSVWHYIYARYPRPRCAEVYNQLFIGTYSNKLHILLPGIYLYAWNPCKDAPVYDSLVKKDVPAMIDSTHGLKLNCSSWQKVNTKTDSSNPELISLLKEMYGDTIQKVDSSTTEVYLRYEPQNKIYYNTIITLDGVYLLFAQKTVRTGDAYIYQPEEKTEIRFDDQKVYAVKLPYRTYSYFYFKNQWFTLDRPEGCIAPLEDVEMRLKK